MTLFNHFLTTVITFTVNRVLLLSSIPRPVNFLSSISLASFAAPVLETRLLLPSNRTILDESYGRNGPNLGGRPERARVTKGVLVDATYLYSKQDNDVPQSTSSYNASTGTLVKAMSEHDHRMALARKLVDHANLPNLDNFALKMELGRRGAYGHPMEFLHRTMASMDPIAARERAMADTQALKRASVRYHVCWHTPSAYENQCEGQSGEAWRARWER